MQHAYRLGFPYFHKIKVHTCSAMNFTVRCHMHIFLFTSAIVAAAQQSLATDAPRSNLWSWGHLESETSCSVQVKLYSFNLNTSNLQSHMSNSLNIGCLHAFCGMHTRVQQAVGRRGLSPPQFLATTYINFSIMQMLTHAAIMINYVAPVNQKYAISPKNSTNYEHIT